MNVDPTVEPSISMQSDPRIDVASLESTTVPPAYFDALVVSLTEPPDPMPRLAEVAARRPRRIFVR